LVVGEIETGYEAIKSGKVDCLQILYNLLCQEAEDLICQASKNGLGVIIRSPLNSGILTGTYNVNQKFNDNDARKNYFLGPEFKNRLRVVDEIQKTLNIPDERLLEFSLSFILSNPGVSSVIPAASTTNQMKRFIEFDRNYFSYSTKEWEKIKAIILKMIKPLKQKFQFY
jgi:aryl-alcohol dehydrogenase-like predicted oxidoreductase